MNVDEEKGTETTVISLRHVLIWLVSAIAAVTLLVVLVLLQGGPAEHGCTTLPAGDPEIGARLFYQEKGCSSCHTVNRSGGKSARELGYARLSRASLISLISTTWNAAPRMSDHIRRSQLRYPSLTDEEVAHLLAFLHTTKYLDTSGDGTGPDANRLRQGCERFWPVRDP